MQFNYSEKSFINERKVEFSVGRSLSQECTFLFDSERGLEPLDVRSQFIIFHLQKYGGTVTSLYKRFSVSCNQKVGKHLAQKKSSAWNMDFTLIEEREELRANFFAYCIDIESTQQTKKPIKWILK